MTWTVSWLTSWDAIWSPRNLEGWTAAYQTGRRAHATPFMHPDVVRAWLAATGGVEAFTPRYLLARHSGGQEVRWLFVQSVGGWRDGRVRVLLPAGGRLPGNRGTQIFDYYEPVVVPVAASDRVLAPGFWEVLGREFESKVGEWFDICTLPRFRPCLLGTPAGSVADDVAPILDLSGYSDLDCYLDSRTPKLRGSVRRRLRRMQEMGKVGLRVYAPGEVADVLAWLPVSNAARSRRFNRNEGVLERYQHRLVQDAMPSGIVHCSALQLDGRGVSWMVGFFHDKVYHGYMRAFDPALAALSPGALHFCLLLDWVLEHGGRMIDFGFGAEAYKSDWTDGDVYELHRLVWRSRRLDSLTRRAGAKLGRRLLAVAAPGGGTRAARSGMEPRADPDAMVADGVGAQHATVRR